MSNQQVLREVIRKAIANGWDSPFGSYNEVIFNHEFAKALFGMKKVVAERVPTNPFEEDPDTDILISRPAWQYHLQQLAIAEDRIEYLRVHALEEGK